MKKNKIKTLALAGALGLSVLGGTLAYFSSSDSIPNVFNTAKYSNEIKEVFESPDKWTPGTTTEKTVTVKNTGNVPMSVRAKITETWVSADGTSLDGTYFTGGDSKNAVNPDGVVTINLNTADYTKDSNGYFVLNNDVSAGATSPSFINSVTFNADTELGEGMTKTVSDDGQTITYTTNQKGYDGARYTLTVHIDTVQADQKTNAWS